ncbi:MAG TPA: methyltransferase domain-containing protein [Candidatus Sulfotelmatobacter sp.]
MKRINTPELLDTDTCPPEEVEISLRDLGRINRWFGGVATSVELVKRVARATGSQNISLLEVASGPGEVPGIVQAKVARHGISLKVTLVDRASTHLRKSSRAIAADALSLPFSDGAFDVVSCNLFAHHLEPDELIRFIKEGLRVSRTAVVINDLVRHRGHLMLVYVGFLFMRCHVSRVDGLASVRRAYIPDEIQKIIASGFPPSSAPKLEIFRRPIFRMGIIVWKP